MTLHILPASVARLDDMLAVMQDAFDPRFGEAWSGAQLTGTLTQEGSWAKLAADDDLVVGFTLCRQIVDEAELLLVAVRQSVRGQGVGSALLSAAARDATSQGAHSIFLEMRDGNASASALYRKQGYVEVGRRRDYYRGIGGERFDAITYRAALSR